MRMQIIQGNLLDCTEGLTIHGCNAQGVMGSGVAKQLRDKYPQIYPSYVKFLAQLKSENIPPLGNTDFIRISRDLSIGSCITQEFYGKDGRKYVDYDAIDEALIAVACHNIEIVNIPYGFCSGLGGGNWGVVQAIIQHRLAHNDVRIYQHR